MAERISPLYLLIGVALLTPVAGLALLIARPSLDLTLEHHPAHFWLVLGTAVLSAALAYAMGAAALLRGDARVLLVSLAFLSSAGFLGLHALATPGVLLDTPNAGFVVATPVGLAIGSTLAALSSLDLAGKLAVRAVHVGRRIRVGLLTLMAVWLVASLARLPPLHQPQAPEQARGILAVLAVIGIALYGVSAWRYFRMWRHRSSLMLFAVLTAFVLLAEALLAVVLARNWHLSWWEWHVLMLTGFALVAAGARAQWREERFADLYLSDTAAGSREVSVLFADLQGFTTFSENHESGEVTEMLNAYFRVAVPAVVDRFGGEIDRIIGDALMVTFNKRGDQPDHARRAAGAGLELQRATAAVVAEHPNWPRFRVGINSGSATVSVLGADGGRTHTVIGDVVNVASRIEGKAPAGGVAIGPGTRSLLPEASTTPLGLLVLKGKAEPVEIHQLLRLADHRGS
jgi:class 3 adenylate cyclase